MPLVPLNNGLKKFCPLGEDVGKSPVTLSNPVTGHNPCIPPLILISLVKSSDMLVDIEYVSIQGSPNGLDKKVSLILTDPCASSISKVLE